MLRKIHFLKSVDSVVVEELLLRLEPRTSMSWDMIVREGDPGDWMAFISSGMVAVLAPHTQLANESSLARWDTTSEQDRLVTILRSGAHFGEPALLAKAGRHRRSCSLQSLSWVQLQVITAQRWCEIKQLYPDETAFCEEMIRAASNARMLRS